MNKTALLDNIIAEQLRPTYEAHVVAIEQAQRNEVIATKYGKLEKQEVALANGDCVRCFKPFTADYSQEAQETYCNNEWVKAEFEKNNEARKKRDLESAESAYKLGQVTMDDYMVYIEMRKEQDMQKRTCRCHPTHIEKFTPYLCEKFPTAKAFADYKLTLADIAYGEVRVNELLENMVARITARLEKKNIELETAELTVAYNACEFYMSINGKHTVKVTVVDAGGYNIQRYHLRQLVHVK